jgi:hypothetical protein
MTMPRPLLLALLVLLSGALGWFLRGVDRRATVRGPSRDAAAAREALERSEVELTRRIAKLEEKLAAERATRSDAARPPPPESPRLPPDAAPATAPGARFVSPETAKALEAVSWESSGESVAKMVPLLDELARAVAAGGPIPPSAGGIQRWNGELVTMALTLQKEGVEGSGVNGAFSHPLVTANLIHASLAKAGLPLDEAQERALSETSTRFLDEDRRRRAGYGESTLAFRRILEECALKDRYYEEVDRILREEQREALHPASIRDRVAIDIFCSGIVWVQHLEPMEFRDTSELRAKSIRGLGDGLLLDDAGRSALGPLVDEWIASFPAGFLEEAPDALAARRWVKMDRVRAVARAELALLEAIPARVPLGPEQRSRLTELTTLALPVRTG